MRDEDQRASVAAPEIAAHEVPAWFGERRYGMFVHCNIATVPAFAPRGEYADWYQAFWQPGLPGVIGHPPAPLPEVLAYHHASFPHVERFDDFVADLTMERFDADDVARLAVDAGMRYLVPVTKHHDGFCFWDSALTPRTSVRMGPHRDVIAELASAAGRADLVFGLYHSLLDWGQPDYPDPERYVDGYLRRQLVELVERFQPQVLWGDGHWDHDGRWWRADAIVADYYAALEAMGVEGCVNDRFQASHADFVTFEYDVPAEPPDGAWELCRGMAHSFCWNRVERARDHLDARGIVSLLTEVVAKGGNLLLNIGPRADGTIPDEQAVPLRDAGTWVRAHSDAIHGSRPWTTWGDADTRYTVAADGAVFAIDLRGGSRVLPALHGVESVVGAREWVERADGLHVDPEPSTTELAHVYRVQVRAPSTVVVRTEAVRDTGLRARLEAAQAGDVITVAPGRHRAERLVVPPGVTLLGTPDAVLDGGGGPALTLRSGALLHGVVVEHGAPGFWFVPPTCVTTAGDEIRVIGCTLESIQLGGGRGHQLVDVTIVGGNVWAFGCEAILLDAVRQQGLRWGQGIELSGGDGHRIVGATVRDPLCGIRLTGCTNAEVRDSTIEARWWGVHLRDCTDSLVTGVRVAHTMRGFCVEGGSGNEVSGNAALDCDSFLIIERGAEDTTERANRRAGCRVDVLEGPPA